MAEPIKLDMALDDLVKTETAKRNAIRGGRRRRGRGAPNLSASASGLAHKDVGSKLLVSNLHFGVTESDLRELFSSMGPLKKVSLAFDANGKSKGTAEILFVRKQDAISSLKKYNNVALDGRPMKIEMTTSVIPDTSVQSRLSGIRNSDPSNSTTSQRGGRGRGRGRGRGGKSKVKTFEELDAEMNAYMQGNGDTVMAE